MLCAGAAHPGIIPHFQGNKSVSFSNPLEVSVHSSRFDLGDLSSYHKSLRTPALTSSGLHPAKNLLQQQEQRDLENICPPSLCLEREDGKQTQQTAI